MLKNEKLKKSADLEENKALQELRAYAKDLPQENLIPLEDFFKNSEISSVHISPNGKYIAYLKPYKKRLNIYVKRLDGSESERRLTDQTSRDIAHFGWKENETLIYLKDFGGDENYHVFRVFVTGEGEKDLTPFEGVKVWYIDLLDNISEESIIIKMNKRDEKVFDAYRLNIKTEELKMIAENPGFFSSWLTDHEGKLRVAFSTEGLDESVYYRETEQEEFQKVMTTDWKDAFYPLLFTSDNKNLYVLSNLKKDKKALQIFDPKNKKVLSTLFSHPEVDISGITYSKKRNSLLATDYVTWKREQHFFDEQHKQIIQDLESKIPNKEISITSKNREEDLFIVFASSDRSPGLYYLYNVKTTKLEKLADPRPWIKEEEMAKQKPLSYMSRDGLKIHSYLTLPKGSSGKNLPVIVVPHGGPWMRDSWGYRNIDQFLASRGYVVFRMNFRGSTGYGKKFWMASFKEWGKEMQDDVTDGVQYLIDQGVADKNRIGIFGGSYGGYVVLAGLAFTPDLYACAADYVGISNLFTLLKSLPPYWELGRKQMYEKIGHPEKDKELLRSASPFFHVDKIKKPLFVIQGANDPRVKKEESDQIVKALKNREVLVPYLVKYNEGHGFRNEENKLEVYSLLEAFFHKCLKQPK